MLITLNDNSTAYITKGQVITINFINKGKSLVIDGNITITINLINKLNSVI